MALLVHIRAQVESAYLIEPRDPRSTRGIPTNPIRKAAAELDPALKRSCVGPGVSIKLTYIYVLTIIYNR